MQLPDQDFALVASDDVDVQVTVRDRNHALLNITGGTITFKVAGLTLTVGNGVTVTNPTAGEFVAALTSANTATLDGMYRYSATLVLNGKTRCVARGTMAVVTK